MKTLLTLGLLAMVSASPTSKDKETNVQGYKDQYCTDPRTMRKHAAYTEWADAYSCTRHRCQPGGRNLAIYTVGCKRVEAPESAIECEEVVEDTNMQFPFCCTRLRCLVVVRGEVWTRVLGQPWEVLPAAPWSHMYKMKKPPPSDTTFQPKIAEQGPVYELSEAETEASNNEKASQRSARKQTPTDSPDCNEVVPRASPVPAPAPDIVIALSTNSEKVDLHPKRPEFTRRQSQSPEKPGMMWQDQAHDTDSETEHKRVRKTTESSSHFFEKEDDRDRHEGEVQDIEENNGATEKAQAPDSSDEKFFGSAYLPKETPQKPPPKVISNEAHHPKSWTDIPQSQWNEHEGMDVDPRAHVMELHYTKEPSHQDAPPPEPEKERKPEKQEKPNNLQALVDAIGSRMKDIENVVQKMSEKVHQTKSPGGISPEKRPAANEIEFSKYHRAENKEVLKPKHEQESSRAAEDHFKPRFGAKSHASKYQHSSTEPTQEPPLFIEDNGNYFSDASNAMRRSNNPPKEPALSAPTYMAPVESHRKSSAHIAMVSDTSEDVDRKKKKHNHKRRRSKTHAHKKHQHQDKRKHFNKLASVETEKNTMSMEDSSGVATA